MARQPALNKEALAGLGAQRLAELALDEAQRNGAFKKLVLAALASTKGPDAIAAIVDKRLAGLERAGGVIAWERAKSFSDDLAAVLKIITGDLAKADADMAFARLLRFLSTADRTLERAHDSNGGLAQIYRDAAAALPGLVETALIGHARVPRRSPLPTDCRVRIWRRGRIDAGDSRSVPRLHSRRARRAPRRSRPRSWTDC